MSSTNRGANRVSVVQLHNRHIAMLYQSTTTIDPGKQAARKGIGDSVNQSTAWWQ